MCFSAAMTSLTRTLWIASSLGLGLALTACGDDDGGSPDASPVFDGAPAIDGATAIDGAPTTDGAPGVDGPTAIDAGADAADPDAAPPAVATNNSALVDGPALVGTGNLQRKVVPVEITSTIPGIEIGETYALGTNSQYVNFVFSIANTGTVDYCDLYLGGITAVDSGGAQLGDSGFAYVLGSVGDISGFFDDTCLRAGERGWVLHVVETGFDPVAGLRVSVGAGEYPFSLPAARIVPSSYTVTQSGVVHIPIENQGTGQALLDLANVILLDEGGAPLGWTYMFAEIETLAASEATELVDDLDTFGGTATSLYVEIPFEDYSGDARAAAKPAVRQRVAASRARLRALTAATR
jgi:hypothetical protein